MNQNDPHAHGMQHCNILNQVLKTCFLDKLTSESNYKGFFTEAMNVGRDIAQPPYEGEVGGRFFGVGRLVWCICRHSEKIIGCKSP